MTGSRRRGPLTLFGVLSAAWSLLSAFCSSGVSVREIRPEFPIHLPVQPTFDFATWSRPKRVRHPSAGSIARRRAKRYARARGRNLSR